MASRFIARVVISSFILSLCWHGQPKAFARDKCQTFVKYSGRSDEISFPTIKGFSLGKFSTKPAPIQVAGDIAQALDYYQYTTCVLLQKVDPTSPGYADLIKQRFQASDRLNELIILVIASQNKPPASSKRIDTSTKEGTEFDEFISQSGMAVTAALKLAGSPEGKEVLDTHKGQWQFNQSRIGQALNNAPGKNSADPIKPWLYIANEERQKILEQLINIVKALKAPLKNFEESKLRTYIFMPRGDGHLQVPDQKPTLATAGVYPRLDSETIKIPIGYGFTGVAYEQKEAQYGCLPGEKVQVEFTMGGEPGQKESQSKARRVLLERDQMSVPTAQWIIAIPLKNRNNEVVAVLSISSDQKPKGFPEKCDQKDWNEWEKRLRTAYQENREDITAAVHAIEELLPLKFDNRSKENSSQAEMK